MKLFLHYQFVFRNFFYVGLFASSLTFSVSTPPCIFIPPLWSSFTSQTWSDNGHLISHGHTEMTQEFKAMRWRVWHESSLTLCKILFEIMIYAPKKHLKIIGPQRFHQMAVKPTHEQPLPILPDVYKHNPRIQMKKITDREHVFY